MTRQEQNNIIIQYLDAEVKDTPKIQERIGIVFNRWFQSLVQMASAPPPMPEGEQNAEGTA